jgi:membrane fusion protein (multidrug efflux system)
VLLKLPGYFIGLAAAVLLPACSDGGDIPIEPDHAVVEAQIVRVQPGTWQRIFKSYGLITPAEEYQLGVEVSATVREVLFQEGDEIQVGDVLLHLDEKRLRLQLSGSKASVEEARANHEQAKSTHERNQPIYRSGVISEQTYLQSEAKLKSTQANLQRSLAAHAIAKQELADAELKSPVNGTVTRRSIEPGQTVTPNERLGIIRVQGALRVESFISQKDINHVRVGMPASVTSPGAPGEIFTGRVDRLASSAELATGNFEVGVVVDDPRSLLRDGMSAMVEFQGSPEEGVLAIPRDALVDRNRRLLVFRVRDGAAEQVEPTVGVGNSEHVPVYDGLQSGDEVIISNLRLISHGQEVRQLGEDSTLAEG